MARAFLAAFAAAGLLTVVDPVLAASIRSVPGTGAGVIVQVQGTIAFGDTATFVSELQRVRTARKQVQYVELHSGGGRLLEGVKLALAIRLEKLPTTVAAGHVCASACFLAYVAGEPRYAEHGALIGVHKASDKGGVESRQSAQATAQMAQFARELGVPEVILKRMVTTPPTEMAWLDQSDLRRMSVRLVQRTPAATVRMDEQVTAQSSRGAQAAGSSGTAVARPRWTEFINLATAISAEQNGGRALWRRSCQQATGDCVTAVSYQAGEGAQILVTTLQSADGSVKRREVCAINESGSYRECTDWDSGETYRERKTEGGQWITDAGASSSR